MRYVAIATSGTSHVAWLADNGATGFVHAGSIEAGEAVAKAFRAGVSAAGGRAAICRGAEGPFLDWTLVDADRKTAERLRALMENLPGALGGRVVGEVAMRFEQPMCPECGEPACGVWEAVPRLMAIQPVSEEEPAGEWEYDPEGDDDVFWEGGWHVDEKDRPIQRDDGDDRIQLHCGEHSWMTRRLL